MDSPKNQTKNIEYQVKRDFLEKYEFYKQEFLKYDITLDIDFLYYYKGKYHTKRNNKSCFMSARIRLYPKNISYKVACNTGFSKEIFSRKILNFILEKNKIIVKKYTINDKYLKFFLTSKLKNLKTKSQKEVLKEKITDILRSFFLIYRYRTSYKKQYRGHDMSIIYGVISIIIIIFIFIILFLDPSTNWGWEYRGLDLILG